MSPSIFNGCCLWLLSVAMFCWPGVAGAASESSAVRHGSIHIAVAPVEDAGVQAHQQLAQTLERTLSEAHYLTGRLTVRALTTPLAPIDLADIEQVKNLNRATGGANMLVWGKLQRNGTIHWYLLHLDTLDPLYQSRQAAGMKPILPRLHRLPDFDPQSPLKIVYAMLGIAYAKIDRYPAASQVLTTLNNFPDLSPRERYPVVFFLALADLVTGVVRQDAAQVDRALYHFGALKSVMGRSNNPLLIGATLINRGFTYQRHPRRKGPGILGKAIESFEAALPYFPVNRYPVIHARILHHIATAEQGHATTHDGVHLHRAILAYRKALRIWTPEQHPEAYRAALHNMALCYQRLPVGDKRQNLLNAISLYKRILGMPQLQNRPAIRAATWGNLGQAYQALPQTPTGQTLWLAIAAYREALRYWDPQRDPAQHRRMQQLSGQAFLTLPVGDPRDNLQRAADHFNKALIVTPVQQYPMEHALLQTKLGVAWARQPGPGERLSLERAQAAFSAALAILTPDNLPYFHAKVVKNLEQVNRRLQVLTAPAHSQ